MSLDTIGLRMPLLDIFRRGNIPREVRLLAAEGTLAPRAHEQLCLLADLVNDEDEEVRRTAEASLAAIPQSSVAALLARSDAPGELKTFFAARGISPASDAGGSVDDPLVDTASESGPPPPGEDEASTLQRIAAMNVAQRLARAMKGSREERAILIRDPNKIVAAAVLSSPKLSETEVESFARMANVSEEILRIIANTRAWTKNYQVVVALTKNPKTPVALSMNLLSRLNERDLRMLSTDRNIPDVLRVTARKKIVIER